MHSQLLLFLSVLVQLALHLREITSRPHGRRTAGEYTHEESRVRQGASVTVAVTPIVTVYIGKGSGVIFVLF